MAYEYAKRDKRPPRVENDAPLKHETRRAYIEIDNFDDPKQFPETLASAKLINKQIDLWVHRVSKFIN
jgi:hypothetical protein